MGIKSWWKREKKAFDEQTPTPGFRITGGPLSISRAKQEFEAQETIHLHMSEIKDVVVDDVFLAGHMYMGTGEDGIKIFKKLTPEQVRAKAAMEDMA